MARRNLTDTTLDGQLTPEQREFVKSGTAPHQEAPQKAARAAETAGTGAAEAAGVERHKDAVKHVQDDVVKSVPGGAAEAASGKAATGKKGSGNRGTGKNNPEKKGDPEKAASRRATVMPFPSVTALVPLNVKISPIKKLMLEEIQDKRRKRARLGEELSSKIQDFVDEALEDWFEKQGYLIEELLEDYQQKAVGE